MHENKLNGFDSQRVINYLEENMFNENQKKCFKSPICTCIFVVTEYRFFQLLLLFTTHLSVYPVTTLKSHTEKNGEYCLVYEAVLIDIDRQSVWDKILGTFDVVLNNRVGGGDCTTPIISSCFLVRHLISTEQQQNSTNLKPLKNTFQGAQVLADLRLQPTTQLQMNSLKDSLAYLRSYLVSYLFACSLKLTSSWQLLAWAR